ncbi:hypothetical protein, variant [Sphaeroforma arctica JP610]|uniref:C3H1-type domain-containing protein n=1 Tax=Sphaeroforma arctica JP610 TaxID=667725 RepID=A0A0L0FMY5_9EUKA|nr:hypothetical protein, variant [Sphaeroforma arctica JP610]KNC78130.1 hypothetical protein, variant [Sphaeroforma arctica JP610]|eukprot:XP_014152032.1 hypothetical protein, variant [Sphaeroforma arctica JP610]
MREHNRRPMRPFLVTEYAKGGTPALTPGAFILNRSVSAEHIPSVSNLNGKSLKTPTAKVAAQMDMDKPGREEATCKTQHSPDDNPGPSHSTSEVLAGTEVCDGQDVADLSAGVPLSDGEGGDYLVKATTLAQTAPASPFSSTYDRPDASKRARSTPKRRKSKELEDIKCNSRRWDVPIRGRMCYIAQARPSTVIPMVVTSYRNQIRCVDGFYVTTRYTDTTRALTNPPCDACGVLARKSKCLFDNCGDCCRDVNNNPCKVHRTKADAMFLQLKADVRRQKLRKQHGMCLMYQAGQCRKGSACYYDHGEGPEMLDIDSEIGTPLRITLCVRDYANESERSTRNDKMSLPQSVLMTALAKEISSPFTFQINQRGSNVMTHGGVWEFTAPENTVLLTPLMQARLGVRSGDMVELKSVSLPSGTFAKFKALDMLSWQRIPTAMVRSLLEFELRKHQTLGVGSVVDVVFADKKCELEV